MHLVPLIRTATVPGGFLRVLPTGGAALSEQGPVGITSLTKNATLSSGTTYYYDVVTSAANTFAVTDPVTVIGSTGADGLIGATVKVVTDSTHFTISMRSVNITSTVTDGKISYAFPNQIGKVSGDGTTLTFTTWGVHGLVAGQKLNISGITPTGYNVTGGTIVAAAANSNVFTVLGTTTAAYTSGGLITGTTSTGFIPDALGHDATTGQMSPAGLHDHQLLGR